MAEHPLWDTSASPLDCLASGKRIEDAAREAVDAFNFYESTLGPHKQGQWVHVEATLRQLRSVLNDE